VNELAAVVHEAREGVAEGAPVVLVTVVAVRGSAYRRPGARMVVVRSQRRAGCVSGGCLERELERTAEFLVRAGPVLRRFDTSEDAGAHLGCGGEVDLLLEPLTDTRFLDALASVTERRQTLTVRTALGERAGEREVRCGDTLLFSSLTGPLDLAACFLETVQPSPRLLVVGAGHDALPVAELAHQLGWAVDVVDWRPALVTAARFPHAQRHVLGPEALSSGQPAREPGSVAVVMSHHLGYDTAAVSALLRDERVVSVGLLGPRHRARDVLERVDALTPLSTNERARLRAPVGLDVGAEGPAAIALSILAEAQALLRGRSGRPLSEASR
jgi:xanthine dehydrogenase accessory factor